MSLVEQEKVDDKYDWNKPNPKDPNDHGHGWSFDAKEGICQICFERIICPIINGIWYHKDSYSVREKNHTPIPASIPLQLFHIFMKPTSFSNKKTRTKKCKHSRWWSEILEFPKLKEGFYNEHYFNSDYISVCGKVMNLQSRLNQQGRNPEFPDDSFNACKRCIEICNKLGMIKITVKKGHEMSYCRAYSYKWLSKKLPKKFLDNEKKKYTKILK